MGLKRVFAVYASYGRPSRNRTIVGLKQKQLEELLEPAFGRNRTIVGLKLGSPNNRTPQIQKSQSHHSGIETYKTTGKASPPPKSQSHHSGIEGVWLSWLTSYGPGVAEAAPG